jgi:hypothetical protein
MQKIKLTGQLINENKSTVLLISSDINKINETANEYLEVFPDIFLFAEWGYFKPAISKEKKKAIANLFSVLNAPLANIFSSL